MSSVKHQTIVLRVSLPLPAGVKVTELPDSVKKAIEESTFAVETKLDGEKLKVSLAARHVYYD